MQAPGYGDPREVWYLASVQVRADRLIPVVDSQYPRERVADALALVKDGRPAGTVVVSVTP